MSSDQTLVIGGGISGIACAAALQGAGADIRIIDRGRVLGGRMASRRLRDTGTAFDGHVVDYGASYFTASHPDFVAQVEEWIDAGIARAWTDGFHVAEGEEIIGVRSGPMRYAAPGGLRSVVEHMAAGIDAARITQPREIASLTHDGSVFHADEFTGSAAALCLPFPQAQRFAAPELLPDVTHVWEPVIAVTAVFDERCWQEIDGVFVNDNPVITWIADDGARRGDGAPVLVAHVNPVLAARHLDDPSSVTGLAIAALSRVLGITELPTWASAHRWSLAKPMDAAPEAAWVHPDLRLGMAGDAWSGIPKVESAWLSGRALGAALGGTRG